MVKRYIINKVIYGQIKDFFAVSDLETLNITAYFREEEHAKLFAQLLENQRSQDELHGSR